MGFACKELYKTCQELQKGPVGRRKTVNVLFLYIYLVLASFCMSGLMIFWYDDRFVRGGQFTSISELHGDTSD